MDEVSECHYGNGNTSYLCVRGFPFGSSNGVLSEDDGVARRVAYDNERDTVQTGGKESWLLAKVFQLHWSQIQLNRPNSRELSHSSFLHRFAARTLSLLGLQPAP